MSTHAALLDAPNISTSYQRGLRYLSHHLVPTEDGSGLYFTGKVRGRVLESALTLHLLRQTDREWRWQNRLSSYLQAEISNTDSFSGLIGAAVLGHARAQGVLDRLRRMMGGLEYGRRRKHALIAMLLVELGLITLEEAQVCPDDFSEKAAHRFSQIYCAALRLMYHRRAPLPLAPTSDQRFLEEAQAANGSWEQQTLLTLLAMMGLGRAHPAFWRGMQFLRELERDEGGIPFIDNQDVWVNSLAGLALQAEGLYPEMQEQLARYILRRQHANGGWAFTDGVVQTDTDDTANCVLMLLQIKKDRHRFVPAVDRALDYFRKLQRPDGGYPTYELEGESEVTMTANILLSQSLCVARRPHLRQGMRRACRFLLDRQHTDGRFEKSWSLCESYSMFRVIWALDMYPAEEETARVELARARALSYLRESQHSDGGWGQDADKPSDALSTAYALASLGLLWGHLPIEPMRIDRAVHYLLTQQDPETGGFVSKPDVAGPRPIPFDLPLLNTVFCLMGLSFAKPAGWARGL